MKIVIATKNQGKIEEIKDLLKDIDNLEILKIDYEDIEENGSTFEENSLIKAKNVKSKTKYAVLSDDSGLLIDAFLGWPGVKTARAFPEIEKQIDKNKALLEKMKDIEDRKAHFKCVLTFIDENNNIYQFVGETFGEISKELKGDKGHGYDPIFYSYSLNKTFGESSIDEKSKVSHRGIAFNKLKDFLKKV